ncbi:MAG: hypothetical protein ACHRXM_05720 [Isosphaerales bacterium]
MTDGSNDPTDDETSRDPTDDNRTSEDINAGEETDAPIVALHQALVLYLIAPETVPATWTETPSSPFVTQPRLRC